MDTTMIMLNARMSALAKLTESESNDTPHIPSFDFDKEETESLNSLIPLQDPLHTEEQLQSTQQDESWKSFINAQSPYGANDSREIFLGPARLSSPDHLQALDDSVPTFGRRADLFVRRSPALSHSPVKMSRASSSQPSIDTEMGGSPPPQVLRASSASDSCRSHSLDNAVPCASDFDYMQEQRTSSSSLVMDNERANWPTSTRHQTWHVPMEMSTSLASQSTSRSESELPSMTFGSTPLMQKCNSMPKPSSKITRTDNLFGSVSCSNEIPTTNMYSVEISDSDVIMSPEDERVVISTTPDAYTVTIHIPGVSIDGLTLAMKGHHRRTLHVMANRWDSDEHFERRITFGPDADMSSIRARFEDGHLYVDVLRKGGTMAGTSASFQPSSYRHVGIQNRAAIRSALF